MLIESYASKIGETRREDERLFQELTGLGIETSRSAMEKEVNEVRIKIDSLKEELAMLDASLGDERQKSVSEVKGELLKLKEAKAERTQELAEIRRLIAECKDKLLVVLKNAEAVNVELEKSRLAAQKRLVEEMRKKRSALKAAATNNPKVLSLISSAYGRDIKRSAVGSYAYHPADGATLPAPGTVRLPSSVQNVDTAKGPVKATTSQPMMANWHAEKSVGKLLRSDNAQESSPMSSKSVGAGDLH
uniref:Uncharacterized protein n=1 Tax=Parascaris univalens TaxID=6257 RepID=A0A915A3X2_PARUN